MAKLLPDQASENSTYIIEVQFKNNEDEYIVPNYIQGSLYDKNGDIINNKENVEIDITDLDGFVNVVLKESDLTPGGKYFVIKGNYDDVYGDNLPFNDCVKFYVKSISE